MRATKINTKKEGVQTLTITAELNGAISRKQVKVTVLPKPLVCAENQHVSEDGKSCLCNEGYDTKEDGSCELHVEAPKPTGGESSSGGNSGGSSSGGGNSGGSSGGSSSGGGGNNSGKLTSTIRLPRSDYESFAAVCEACRLMTERYNNTVECICDTAYGCDLVPRD